MAGFPKMVAGALRFQRLNTIFAPRLFLLLIPSPKLKKRSDVIEDGFDLTSRYTGEEWHVPGHLLEIWHLLGLVMNAFQHVSLLFC